MNNTFDPVILADDLCEVRRIYAEFFARLDETDWDKPVKGSPKEWTLHEMVAHLVALNCADGLLVICLVVQLVAFDHLLGGDVTRCHVTAPNTGREFECETFREGRMPAPVVQQFAPFLRPLMPVSTPMAMMWPSAPE